MDMNFKIVFIDDNLTEKDPFVQNIRKKFPHADHNNIFQNPKEGLDFVLENLNNRMIVFLDWKFDVFETTGLDVLQSIREKTSLLYVVMMSANQLGSNINPASIVQMMNEEHFFYIDRSNSDFNTSVEIINKIQKHWQTDFDCVLEDWLVKHPEDNTKEAYRTLKGNSYTWNDILRELRLQSEIGKSFEKMTNEFYIYQINRSKK